MRGGHGRNGKEIVLTYSYDCKTLVDKDAVLPDEATGPVRPSVAQTLRQGDGTRSGCCRIVQPMDTEYSAHFSRVGYATATWRRGKSSDLCWSSTVQLIYEDRPNNRQHR